MFSARLAIAIPLLILAACGPVMDDLNPSGVDNRVTSDATTTGHKAGQTAPDFTLTDIDGNAVNLYGELARADAVVMYFTMWCPICDSHMDHMLNHAARNFPNVKFMIVDYVSGSVKDARAAASSSGYASTAYFTVLADIGEGVVNAYGATMGTTVVIDSSKVVRMNENYKDGKTLENTLGAL